MRARNVSQSRLLSNKSHPAIVRAAVCEVMEARRMLAADATLASGLLSITGTSGADFISVNKSGSKLVVDLGAVNKEFTSSNVNNIVVNLMGGSDSFLSFNEVTKPMLVYGGAGNDSIRTGGGQDVVYGESGNDSINVRNGDDVMDGGSGTDTADYSDRTGNLTITLDNAANDGGPGGKDNVKSSMENIIGGTGNDLLIGSLVANNIFGFKGNDTIYGNSGNDTLDGGNGAESGDNEVHGGPGNDHVEGGSTKDSLYGEAGNDTLVGEGGNDKLYGGTENDRFEPGTGNDKNYGASGNDTFIDSAGVDYYEGWSGADSFYADKVNKTEADEFKGGADFDYIYYSGRADSVRIQTDDVANDGFTDGTHGPGVELDNVHSDIEGLVATDHGDGIYAKGNHNNVIIGGKGGDYIDAGPGNDIVDGGEGDDWIFGDTGNDNLFGAAGKDSIDGGTGNDTLGGSSGNDVLHGQSGNDSITGGTGTDQLFGESGNDKLFSDDNILGETVNGGSGTDTADVDTLLGAPLDAITSIEDVD